MDLSWDAIASKMVWSGRFPVLVDRIRSREDGREYDYTYLGITGGAVCVLALDEMDQAICVRQYRHPSGQVLLELPAGHLEPDELPASCAHREFEEETGLRLVSRGAHCSKLSEYKYIFSYRKNPLNVNISLVLK